MSNENTPNILYKKRLSYFKINDMNPSIKDLDEFKQKKLISMAQTKIEKIYNLGNYSKFKDHLSIKENINVEIFQKKFKDGLKCPKCGHSKLNKNGITNNRQRFICKKCRITFDERSFSPLSNTKLSLETWSKYCQYMIEGGSIRECAKRASVSVPTSFFMRHRILDILNLTLKNQVFAGLVFADIQFLNESFKGKSINQSIEEEKYFSNFYKNKWTSGKSIFMNYKPFSKNTVQNIKPTQVMINTAMDTNGHILTRIAEKGPFKPNSGKKSDTMLSFFEDRVSENTTLCAFDGGKYKYVASLLNIKFKKAKSRMREDIYTVNHVFQYNLHLKKWLANFNGVATKYLNNYLSWYTFLSRFKNLTKVNKINDLFMEFSTINLSITKEKIQNRSIELIM